MQTQKTIIFIGEVPMRNYSGGSHTLNYELLKRLYQWGGARIVSLCPDYTRSQPLDLSLPFNLLTIPSFRKPSPGDLLAKHLLAKRVRAFLSKNNIRPDLIHIDATAGLASLLPGIPKTIFLHGSAIPPNGLTPFLKHPYAKLCSISSFRDESRAIKSLDIKRIFINSSYSRSLFIKNHSVTGQTEKIEIVPLGADQARIVPTATKQTSKQQFCNRFGLRSAEIESLLLFVGGIADVKGQFELLKLFKKILESRPKTVLVLAGKDSGDLPRCAKFVKESKLTKQVLFTGHLENDDLLNAFQSADVYVSASLETFGINILEAMLAELPVVALNKGAIGEIFQNQKEGLLANTGSEFITQVGNLLSDPQERKQIGSAARSRAQTYTWDQTASRVVALFNEILR